MGGDCGAQIEQERSNFDRPNKKNEEEKQAACTVEHKGFVVLMLCIKEPNCDVYSVLIPSIISKAQKHYIWH
jgi:hypothetical protein